MRRPLDPMLARGWARRSALPAVTAGLVIVAVWVLLSRLMRNTTLLPGPVVVVETLWRLLVSGALFQHTGASLGRIFLAWTLAVVAAIPLGIGMGRSERLDRYVRPFVELFRPISPLAWIPLAILCFGIGLSGKVFIKPGTRPEGPRRIRNVVRMFGVFPPVAFSRGKRAWVVADELHRKINERRWRAIPTAVLERERISVRMTVFAPRNAEHASERRFYDIQAVLEFVRGRMASGEACSTYRGTESEFSPWRGTTRLIVDAVDYHQGAAVWPWEALVREVLA